MSMAKKPQVEQRISKLKKKLKLLQEENFKLRQQLEPGFNELERRAKERAIWKEGYRKAIKFERIREQRKELELSNRPWYKKFFDLFS